MKNPKIKITINIITEYKNQLDKMVEEKEVSSLTEAINQAIAEYIKNKRKERYDREMEAAVLDKDYIKRHMEVQNDFKYVDLDQIKTLR